MTDKFPFRITVIRITPKGRQPQTYNAEDIRAAMTIADREQGKRDVLSVRVETTIHQWSKAVNVSADGTVATGWNGRERQI